MSSQKQKRARSQLSCDPCRLGKLKCSRKSPCDQCEKRNRSTACTYPPPAAKSRRDNNVKGRIRHLEKLVVDLMNSKAPPSDQATTSSLSQSRNASIDHDLSESSENRDGRGTSDQFTPPDSSGEDNNLRVGFTGPPPAVNSASTAFGKLKINGSETSYVGSAHWASILDDISDLKRELDDDDDELEPDEWQHVNDLTAPSALEESSNIGSLLRSPKRLTKAELLSSLPPKAVVDQLVSAWFNSHDPFRPIVHKVQFENEYRQFWQDPHRTPDMWLGLLYAIMSLGSVVCLRSLKDFTSPIAMWADSERYQDLCAASLVLADYTTPKAFTIECLMLYAGYSREKASALDLWLLTGVIIRLALHMGYHRDGVHYGLSPYACEMRRRTYSILYIADTLTSFQLGLPAILRSVQSDNQSPQNLLDQDFGLHTKDLPPPRSMTEYTPSGYMSAKFSICRVFSEAAELSHATIPPSYADVMALDAKLEQAGSQIPSALRAKAYEMNVTEPLEVMICAVALDLMFLKSKCVLHRRFMTSTASVPAQTYSREACIESAMKMLRHYHAMIELSQVNCQREYMAWPKTDFLLAAMLICLALSQDSCSSDPISLNQEHASTREEMIQALQKTKAIWEEQIRRRDPSSSDAIRACKAITAMLKLVKTKTDGTNPTFDGYNQGVPTTQESALPEGSVLESYRASQPLWQTAVSDVLPSICDESIFGNMMDDTENFNWATWDQQLGSQQQQQQIPDELFNWSMQGMVADGSLSDDAIAQSFDLEALQHDTDALL